MADSLIDDLARRIARRAFSRVRPRIGSVTLRNALVIQKGGLAGEFLLYIPHYWAVYYHDGRDAFGPRIANFLVFFSDPNDDPRLTRGHAPERFSQLGRLTKAQFDFGLRENARIRRATGGTGTPYMYVVQKPDGSPGSVAAQRGQFFFTDGMMGFATEIGPLVLERFDDFIQEEMPRPEVIEARFRI